ncbi:MAG: hypothetical protein J6K32_11345, partial [Clostridia bacterium]|nr:hypothetical protein [Clostridia bacterium]
MKPFARLLALLMLVLMLPACGLAAQEAVNCYWQLDSVSSAVDAGHGQGSAVTPEVSGLSAAEMTEAVRGESSMQLSLQRPGTGAGAQAEYTFSGMPAVVPGSARARLSVCAATRSEPASYYLYMTIFAEKQYIARVRGTGAWVMSIPFPRRAVPGETRTVTLHAREYNGRASVKTTYVYRACPGRMLVDVNGDVVLYDQNDNETARIPQSVADILPEMTAGSADSETLFAAEAQEDGSMIVRLRPDNSLSTEELIRLIRTAIRHAGEPDAMTSATFVSPLTPDHESATLYIAPDAELSDDVLRALIAQASGKAIDTRALSEDVTSGAVALKAQATPTPAPLTLNDMRSLISSGDAGEEEIPFVYESDDGETSQSVVIYNQSGVQALALTAGAEADGKQMLEVIDRIEQLRSLGVEALPETVLGSDEAANALGITSLSESTMLRIAPDQMNALHEALNQDVVVLSGSGVSMLDNAEGEASEPLSRLVDKFHALSGLGVDPAAVLPLADPALSSLYTAMQQGSSTILSITPEQTEALANALDMSVLVIGDGSALSLSGAEQDQADASALAQKIASLTQSGFSLADILGEEAASAYSVVATQAGDALVLSPEQAQALNLALDMSVLVIGDGSSISLSGNEQDQADASALAQKIASLTQSGFSLADVLGEEAASAYSVVATQAG